MLKLQWDTLADPYQHCFVIGNKESIFMLWFYLTYSPSQDGTKPINIKVFDLSGTEQDTTYWPSVQGEQTYQ